MEGSETGSALNVSNVRRQWWSSKIKLSDVKGDGEREEKTIFVPTLHSPAP